MQISFKPIGIVHNQIKARHAMTFKGVRSEIHIFPEYKKALLRIENEKHLWVLSYLHHAKRDVLTAKPRKLPTSPQIRRGVFVIHSPDRPNPIALSKVRLIKRKGLILEVAGLDVIDSTPVLDIKSFYYGSRKTKTLNNK